MHAFSRAITLACSVFIMRACLCASLQDCLLRMCGQKKKRISFLLKNALSWGYKSPQLLVGCH